MDGPSNSTNDSDEEVGFPSVVLYAVDKRVVLDVFV